MWPDLSAHKFCLILLVKVVHNSKLICPRGRHIPFTRGFYGVLQLSQYLKWAVSLHKRPHIF